MRYLIKLFFVAASLGLGLPAGAQTFPSKPLRIIVPFGPGGTSDLIMRAIATEMSQTIGQPVVVENKVGAGGAIGAMEAARAAPDGYTMLAGNNGTHIVNALLKRTAANAYDPYKDFDGVTLVQKTASFIAVNPKLGVSTLDELVALAKTKPEGVTVATPSNAHMLAVEYLGHRAGVKFRVVPYKGPGPAMADTIAGHVDMILDTGTSVLPQTQAGKLKLIAAASPERMSNMPDLPTVAETYPGYEIVATSALFVPANTPPDVVAKLTAEAQKALAQPQVIKLIVDGAGAPASGDGKDVRQWLDTSTALWRNMLDSTGVSLD